MSKKSSSRTFHFQKPGEPYGAALCGYRGGRTIFRVDKGPNMPVCASCQRSADRADKRRFEEGRAS